MSPAKGVNLAPIFRLVGVAIAAALAGAGGATRLSPAPAPLVCPPCPVEAVSAPPVEAPIPNVSEG